MQRPTHPGEKRFHPVLELFYGGLLMRLSHLSLVCSTALLASAGMAFAVPADMGGFTTSTAPGVTYGQLLSPFNISSGASQDNTFLSNDQLNPSESFSLSFDYSYGYTGATTTSYAPNGTLTKFFLQNSLGTRYSFTLDPSLGGSGSVGGTSGGYTVTAPVLIPIPLHPNSSMRARSIR